jgi:hypothetical protein
MYTFTIHGRQSSTLSFYTILTWGNIHDVVGNLFVDKLKEKLKNVSL